ncbi:N-acetylmuramoyl-L-alanine amidase [Alkalicoccus halolimnae]|uniref:N-acetylmuramoyl-L-alanine amidase n=1 Tax=Alkalicoccus halolimnae TaxID=1667239 RepID=A0A5C7FA34_9BACI|nr:N-acetylmuramoyl-L-alanine amidase [Alkalicoccus halolimnae]TXF86983.1 SH3 domain-containing protein [Alkalicoccus halolimnae]
MKKNLIWILSLVLLLTFFAAPASASTSFSDTNASEVQKLAQDGIVKGKSPGVFSPRSTLTRAEAATMIARAINADGKNGKSSFDDARGHWAEGEIAEMERRGIINGYGDQTFRPNADISRQEMTTVLSRAFTYNPIKGSFFTDVKPDSFYYKFIRELGDAQIVNGYQDGTYRPKETITRIDFSYMVARTLYSEFSATVDSVALGNAKSTGVVTSSGNLNVRPSPSTEYSALGSIPRGTTVSIHEREGNWALVSTKDIRGYVSLSFIDEDGEKEEEVDNSGPGKVIAEGKVVNANNLNVRTGPGTSNDRVGTIPNGTTVNVHELLSGWAKVSTDSVTGYVSLYYLQIIDPEAASSLQGKTVVIDAGHGGNDPGAVANGLQEKEINLDVSLRLETRLKAAGANVVMTRRSDWYPSLAERVRVANNAKADIFISVHANAAGATSASGTETFFDAAYWGGDSKKLAENLQTEMIDKLKTRDRGVKQQGFYVIRNTTMPSVLVELGFMTNKAEADRMKTNSFRNAAADALYEGTVNYFK